MSAYSSYQVITEENSDIGKWEGRTLSQRRLNIDATCNRYGHQKPCYNGLETPDCLYDYHNEGLVEPAVSVRVDLVMRCG